MSRFLLIVGNMGEAMVHAAPGCADVVLVDSKRPGRGKIFAVDEIRVTETAIDDPRFAEVMQAVVESCIGTEPPLVTPIFAGIIHLIEADGSSTTPCCSRVPTELPRTDRITTTPALATCGRYAGVVEQLLGLQMLPWQRFAIDHLVASAGTRTPTQQDRSRS